MFPYILGKVGLWCEHVARDVSIIELAPLACHSVLVMRAISYAQLQEISYAPELNQETYIQTELQRNMFEVEHLIYNQWCSQYKLDTNS